MPLPLPAPQPRALAAAQVRTVKNIVDRIETFHELKGRRHRGTSSPRGHAHARPLRDRAIIYLLFGTGVRRAEITGAISVANLHDSLALEPTDAQHPAHSLPPRATTAPTRQAPRR